MIILEGMDGTGKSTFAKRLALPVIHPGAPPKTKEAEEVFFAEQFQKANQPVIYDRVTCISQQVYQNRLFDNWYWHPLWKMIAMPHCVVVYCRPPDDVVLDFSKHTVEEHDDQKQMEFVRQNGKALLERYDYLMTRVPHLTYDFTQGEKVTQDLIVYLLRTQFVESEWKTCLRNMKKMLAA